MLVALDAVLQVYVLAPEAVSVAVDPLQIVVLATEIVGFEKTLTVLTAVLELTQPAALVPVIEYEFVDAGETVALPPVIV